MGFGSRISELEISIFLCSKNDSSDSGPSYSNNENTALCRLILESSKAITKILCNQKRSACVLLYILVYKFSPKSS